MAEKGQMISDADIAKMKRLLSRKNEGGKTVSDADVARMNEMLGKVQTKEMGGEVIDMTKAQPVGMMDGGKVKKMNMGGVVPGRGGKFKGMR
tara:strand:- start:1361 stop:1636 length:276 start_codon:yes stop_codon:yes gene_type:complete